MTREQATDLVLRLQGERNPTVSLSIRGDEDAIVLRRIREDGAFLWEWSVRFDDRDEDSVESELRGLIAGAVLEDPK